MSILKLFLIFVKIGAILLGGGYVILPILQDEFIYKRHIISQEDLVNYYALAQSLPGIVAANMSMFIGYKLKGKYGALAAMFGIIFIPFWIVILLASILSSLVNNIYVQGAMYGVGISVIALIILTAREMWQTSQKSLFFYSIFLMALIALLIFKMSPICTIIIFSCAGIIIKFVQRRFVK